MEDRNYIIDRLISRSMTKEEFDFEKLAAPPIGWIFSMQDINDLYHIATSLKYSARPDIKYQLIDHIMTKRGFEKFQAGTNRVTYRFLEDQSFVAKVAYSKQSCNDNIREFQNQRFLKPFVTKVFEVVPSGVLGFFERVKPINSREEFVSVADDIFVLIKEFLIGEYVLDDIGTKYFMNYGIRTTHSKGGGPVLLDFPYVYKLDGNKLFCNAPNEFSPTGRCDGEIDYDEGFNVLRCCRCGVEYKAYELKKAEDNEMIIKRSKGGPKMKFSTSGGSGKDVKIETGSNEVKSTPKKPIKNKNNVSVALNGREIKTSGLRFHTTASSRKEEPEDAIEIDESLMVPEMQVKDSRPKVAKEAPAEEPEAKEEKAAKEAEESPLVQFCNYIEKAWTILDGAYADNHYKVDEFMESLITVYRQNRASSTKYILEDLKAIFNEYECIDEEAQGFVFDADSDSEFVKMLQKSEIPSAFITALFEAVIKNNINNLVLKIFEVNGEYIPAIAIDYPGVETQGATIGAIVCGDPIKIEVQEDNAGSDEDEESIEVEAEEVEEEETEDGAGDTGFTSYRLFAASTINIKDLFPSEKRRKDVIAITGPDGEFLTIDDGELLAIDKLDNRAVNNLAIVPKSWYKTAVAKLGEEEEETKETPLGVNPPENNDDEELSVNGVTEE